MRTDIFAIVFGLSTLSRQKQWRGKIGYDAVCSLKSSNLIAFSAFDVLQHFFRALPHFQMKHQGFRVSILKLRDKF